jgi:transcriptional regulator with XRE-family HTH domain
MCGICCKCEFAYAKIGAMNAVSCLKKYQRENGLTQDALAARLGVTPSMVSLWLARKRGPSLATALQIEARTGGAVMATGWGKRKRRAKRPHVESVPQVAQ